MKEIGLISSIRKLPVEENKDGQSHDIMTILPCHI